MLLAIAMMIYEFKQSIVFMYVGKRNNYRQPFGFYEEITVNNAPL